VRQPSRLLTGLPRGISGCSELGSEEIKLRICVQQPSRLATGLVHLAGQRQILNQNSLFILRSKIFSGLQKTFLSFQAVW
jgi:hypothetical protein